MLGARLQLKRQVHQCRQFVRGQLRAVGIELARGSGRGWWAEAHAAAKGRGGLLGTSLMAMLAAGEAMREQIAGLDREIRRVARQDAACRRMMTAPGAGVLTSLALRTSLDDAERFARSAEVGPYLGLTPSRCGYGGARAEVTWPVALPLENS